MVTLLDQKTDEFLARNFVLLAHNQVPKLYTPGHSIEYSDEQVARAIEGSGGANVRAYFCTADGRVVGYLSGMWGPVRFGDESRWALQHIDDDPQTLKVAHEKRGKEYKQQRDKLAEPAIVDALIQAPVPCEPSEKKAAGDLLRKVSAFNRLIRSHDESEILLDQHIGEVLRNVEEEVYTKGALG